MRPIIISLVAIGATAAPSLAFGRDYAQPLTDRLRLQNAERIIQFRRDNGYPVTPDNFNQYQVCQRLRAFTGYDRDCSLFLY